MTASKIVAAAASGVGGAGLDVDEVFSTFLWAGNSTNSRNIVNNIDVSGEGALVWIKDRTVGDANSLFATDLGANKTLLSSETDAMDTVGTSVFESFNSNGFTVGSHGRTNENNRDYVSWTFRKTPKFFDVVTYTGNGVAGRTISHNLDTLVGMLIIKCTSHASDFSVQHRMLSPSKYLALNEAQGQSTDTARFHSTAAGTSTFTVGSSNAVNGDGRTYVAYLFAHNNNGNPGEFGPNSDQHIIKCGSFTRSASSDTNVDLGFEPQWVMVKKTSSGSGAWFIVDTMRGVTDHGSNSDEGQAQGLYANTTNAEDALDILEVTSTGFRSRDTHQYLDGGEPYIYMAIRKGPLAAPTDATKVFSATAYSGNGSSGRIISSNTVPVVDLAIVQPRAAAGDTNTVADRLRGKNRLFNTQNPHPESTNNTASISGLDLMSGIEIGNDTRVNWSSTSSYIAWFWRRAPSFFEIIPYTGTGSNRTVSHNLGVEPEMMWLRRRDGGNSEWIVYHKDAWDNTQSHSGNSKIYELSSDSNTFAADILNYTAPTSSVFSVGTSSRVNGSSSTYICYLWASVTGVSKCGSYTGNGSSQNIDCGFSNGARFVLIKNSSASDNWMIFDSVRGINSGTEGYLRLNSSAAEYTTGDHIDPYSGGFAATSNDPSTNKSGDAYIFYAIA